MTIRPGETQRWRILNASANVTYLLHLDGHQLHQISKDGNTLNETWTRDAIVLAPGERAEALVQAGPAGTYAFRTLPISTGINTQQDTILATLIVDGDAMTAAATADDAPAAGGPLDRYDRPAPPNHLPVLAADRSKPGHLLDRPPAVRRRPRRSGGAAQYHRGVGDPQREHELAPIPHPYQRLPGRRRQRPAECRCATTKTRRVCRRSARSRCGRGSSTSRGGGSTTATSCCTRTTA